ncbi:MAG: hypothetical protein HRJ53_07770 [Acidobacteria bacterium Pan2503]|uniref:Uncharacterized protein n=1 Tax=Candidatus Acidiferrum panamense TaxID=2741543 RepID=A0A7V8NP13_9BACT|nr:hypothetical protein [Candidatus Acidoferrum panamensis]
MISTGALWNSTFQSKIQAGANAFLATLATGTVTQGLVVYSRYHNVMTPVTTAIARYYLGTQRRRAEAAE